MKDGSSEQKLIGRVRNGLKYRCDELKVMCSAFEKIYQEHDIRVGYDGMCQ